MKTFTLTLATAALLALTAGSAEAQKLRRGFLGISNDGISFGAAFGKRGKHFGFGVNLGHPRHGHHAPVHHVPAPHVHSSCCRPVHRAGYWRTIRKPVHTRGYYKKVHVPAVYETRRNRCGRPIRVCVRRAYWKRVWVAPCTTYVNERVWVPGSTSYSCGY